MRIPAPTIVQSCLSLLLFLDPPCMAGSTLPANLIVSPRAHPHHVLLVEKASQQLYVYRFGRDYHLIRSYPCATGENNGDKEASGDRKTPEGIYFFTKAVDSRHLSPTYGARAFPMNYPNLLDKRRGKDGDGIWLHGTNGNLDERSTNGCIAMRNEDIVKLDGYIELWQTPIIVEDKLTYTDRLVLQRQGRRLLDYLEGWRRAWSDKQLGRYLSYYAPTFRWRNLDLQGWRRKKQRLNRLYRAISVQLSDIRFFRQADMVLAACEEIYRSDRFSSHGYKRLYLVNNSPGWQILGEEWLQSGRPPPPPLQLAAGPEAETLDEFLSKWRNAWQRGDLSVYIDCYHPDFRAKGMDIYAWKAYKKRLFLRAARRKIDLSDIHTRINGQKARLTCKQRYREPGYQDYGLKTLHLRHKDGHWFIIAETWKPLPEPPGVAP